MSLQFEIESDKNLADECVSEIRDYTARAMKEIGVTLAENIQDTFDFQGKRGGSPQWEPTSVIALRNRVNVPSEQEIQTGNFKTLIDTGTLQDSIEDSFDESTLTLEVGSDLHYAKGMQEGTSFKGHEVPARPFVFLTDDDSDEIDDILEGTEL